MQIYELQPQKFLFNKPRNCMFDKLPHDSQTSVLELQAMKLLQSLKQTKVLHLPKEHVQEFQHNILRSIYSWGYLRLTRTLLNHKTKASKAEEESQVLDSPLPFTLTFQAPVSLASFLMEELLGGLEQSVCGLTDPLGEDVSGIK